MREMLREVPSFMTYFTPFLFHSLGVAGPVEEEVWTGGVSMEMSRC